MPTGASTSGSDAATADSSRRHQIEPGTSIEVRARFNGRWCDGFEVADLVDADASTVRYRVRRTSDGAILPVLFAADDIHSARASRATR
jgi:hypothetical protein